MGRYGRIANSAAEMRFIRAAASADAAAHYAGMGDARLVAVYRNMFAAGRSRREMHKTARAIREGYAAAASAELVSRGISPDALREW